MSKYTFYLKKEEFELLIDANIETKLNTILGDTWENALHFSQENNTTKVGPKLSNDNCIIGFIVQTKSQNITEEYDGLLNFLNCKFTSSLTKEQVEKIRKEEREIIRHKIT